MTPDKMDVTNPAPWRPAGQNSCQGATTTTDAGRVDIYDDGQQASMGAPQAVRKGLKVLPGVAGGGAPASRSRQFPSDD